MNQFWNWLWEWAIERAVFLIQRGWSLLQEFLNLFIKLLKIVAEWFN